MTKEIHVGDVAVVSDITGAFVYTKPYLDGYSDHDDDYTIVAHNKVCIVTEFSAYMDEVYIVTADKQGWISIAYINVIS